MGKAGKTVLLEVVVKPPIAGLDENSYKEEMDQFEDIQQILSITESIPEPEPSEPEEPPPTVSVAETAKHLGNSMGMSFDKVGGFGCTNCGCDCSSRVGVPVPTRKRRDDWE
jgi:hypothetical protein